MRCQSLGDTHPSPYLLRPEAVAQYQTLHHTTNRICRGISSTNVLPSRFWPEAWAATSFFWSFGANKYVTGHTPQWRKPRTPPLILKTSAELPRQHIPTANCDFIKLLQSNQVSKHYKHTNHHHVPSTACPSGPPIQHHPNRAKEPCRDHQGRRQGRGPDSLRCRCEGYREGRYVPTSITPRLHYLMPSFPCI